MVERYLLAGGTTSNSEIDGFVEGVLRVVKNDQLTSFWEDVWFGQTTLRARFPRLYHLSMQQGDTIALMGPWREGCWSGICGGKEFSLGRKWTFLGS